MLESVDMFIIPLAAVTIMDITPLGKAIHG